MRTLGIITLSGDPITLGHLWMADEALRYFNHVELMIGHNSDKKYLFSLEERIRMARSAVKAYFREPLLHRVKVTHQIRNDYIALQIKDRYSDYDEVSLVRGLRNGIDLEYERQLLHVNRKVNDQLGCVFIMPTADVQMISSSIVKSQYKLESWHNVANEYVTANVRYALEAKSIHGPEAEVC